MAPKQMGFINLPDVLKRVMMRPCCGSGSKWNNLKVAIPRLKGGEHVWDSPRTEKLDQNPPKSPRVFGRIRLISSMSEDELLEDPKPQKQEKKSGKVLSRQVLSQESIDKL